MVDALRFHEERGEMCPANWSKGEDGLVDSRDGVIDHLFRFAKKAS